MDRRKAPEEKVVVERGDPYDPVRKCTFFGCGKKLSHHNQSKNQQCFSHTVPANAFFGSDRLPGVHGGSWPSKRKDE